MKIYLYLYIFLVVALGCSAKVGPGEHGWVKYDICGFEGGVASELSVMGGNSWRLGCTDPPPADPNEEETDQ